jgi:UDP-arabinose 4-epimerase
MDYPDPKKKGSFVGKILLAAALTALCILVLKRSSSFNAPSPVTFLSYILISF